MSDIARSAIKKWREDPILFVQEVFKADPEPWQADVLRAFVANKRIAMKSSKGPGKSCLLAWVAWNFLLTRPYPKMVATSISGENLADGLWSEMAKWQKKSKILEEMFTWTRTRIFSKEHPETWFLSARTWAKSADSQQQADTLAGIHADYVLFILDEAGGIPDGVMAAAEAGLSGGIETKIVMAGNPTHHEGPLYRACTKERSLWYIKEITSDPDDPNRARRVSIDWAKEQIAKYGRDDPWVMVNVFGQFPPTSLNALLGPDIVMAAMKKGIREEEYNFSQKRLGIDVARFGLDSTVLFPRQGLRAFMPTEMRAARTNEIAARAALIKKEWGSEMEFVDDTGGYGAGVVDSMIQGGLSPQAVNFSGKAIDPRYYNKRAEMWFLMAEWVKKGGVLPNIPELLEEMTQVTYTFHNGKFRIEDKDAIKERIGRSPDRSDALCFLGGTKIRTPIGDVEIQNIKKGDTVCTPYGDRRVLKTWESETDVITKVEFSDGSVLAGRREHAVFTWDSGWVRLDALSLTNTIESISNLWVWQFMNLFFIKIENIGFKRLVDIFNQTGPLAVRDFYIGTYGWIVLEKFLKDFIFTIRMAIGGIIRSRTLRWSTALGTNQNMRVSDFPIRRTWPPRLDIWQKRKWKPPNGTEAGLGERGTASMEKSLGLEGLQIKKSGAYTAEKMRNHFSKEQSFVLESAAETRPIGPIKRLVGIASFVRKYLSLTNIARKNVVPVSVQTGTERSLKRVYNLTVEKDNVYYANGILVANCLTFALPEMPAFVSGLPVGLNGQIFMTQKALHEYDPIGWNTPE